jgi:hypothetical protein
LFVNSYELQLSVSAAFPRLVIPSEAEGPAVSFLLATFGWRRWVLTQSLKPIIFLLFYGTIKIVP